MNTSAAAEEKGSLPATAQSQSEKPPAKSQVAARKHKVPGKTSSKPVALDRKSPGKARNGAASARRGSKTSKVLNLLRRPKGATLRELMKATGWQAHSVRGLLSGTLRKRMGLNVASTKGGDNERQYSLSR